MTLQLRDRTDVEIVVGDDITLTCDIQLSEVLINVTMIVELYRDELRLSDSTRISITTTTAGPSEVQSIGYPSDQSFLLTVGDTGVQPSSLLYREHLPLSQHLKTDN